MALLRSLDLSVNNIRRLRAGTFADSSRLRNLYLSRNPLEELESGSLHGLTSLRRLSLAFVPSPTFAAAGDAFRDLVSLTALDADSSPSVVAALLGSDEILSSLGSVSASLSR